MKKVFSFTLNILAVLFYSNLQAQWQSIGSGIDSLPRRVFTIHAVDENVVWGCATHTDFDQTFEFTKTTDGGANWKAGLLPDSIGSHFPGCIYALDSQTAWILMISLPDQDKIRLFNTTSGGLSWQEQTGPFNTSGFGMANVHFFNSLEGILFGSPGTGSTAIDTFRIYRTADGGANWTRVSGANMPALIGNEGNWVYGNNRYENYGDTLWCVTRKARVFKTTNRGVSWQAYATGVTNTGGMGLAAIAFQNTMQGIVTSDNKKAARTTDGGLTWNTLPMPSVTLTGDIEFVPGTASTYMVNQGFLNTGNSSVFLMTKDGGNSWDTITYTPAVPIVQFLSPTVAFAGGKVISSTSGGFYKWTGDLSDSVATNIADINPQAGFKIYPNPAAIQISVTGSSVSANAKINIINLLGEIVKEKQTRSEQTEVDIADLPKGMYMVQLNANGKTYTQKLIICQ